MLIVKRIENQIIKKKLGARKQVPKYDSQNMIAKIWWPKYDSENMIAKIW